MKTSCNTVLFGGFSLERAIENISNSGYHAAELAALPGMAPHIGANSPNQIDRIRSMVDEANLELSSIEAGGVRDDFEAILQVAEGLSIPVVAIGSGGRMNDEDSFQQVVEMVGDAADRAGEHDVKVAVKAHVHAAVYDSRSCVRLLKEVDSRYAGINFDPSHIFRAGEMPQDAALKVGSGIIHSHFRDAPKAEMGPPGTPFEQIPGTGKIDLGATVASLSKVGYEGYLSLEVIGGGTPLSSMDENELVAIAARSQGYMLRLIQES